MNGMFRFKATNGKNDVSLCIFFKGLTGRVVVDGRYWQKTAFFDLKSDKKASKSQQKLPVFCKF